MSAKAVFSPDAPNPPPFLSQALAIGNPVFCSGQVAIDPKTGAMIGGSVGDRTKRIMLNLSAVLNAAGSSLDRIVKANIYLTNIKDFAEVNEARTCVGVAELPLGTDVEIECAASRGSRRRNNRGL
ncbi:putative translation initiation inhibitor, yjgF family [Thelonectria olida]|uniref:Translation initiation inhibitor, yjgF family n=1 Tax=Thelonectria olida TaxID=1576542 RepID=A0A9P8W5B3_9HYPO|nr:putative translation initiation inhibitor, yjgF family [Thelonectria olida]